MNPQGNNDHSFLTMSSPGDVTSRRSRKKQLKPLQLGGRPSRRAQDDYGEVAGYSGGAGLHGHISPVNSIILTDLHRQHSVSNSIVDDGSVAQFYSPPPAVPIILPTAETAKAPPSLSRMGTLQRLQVQSASPERDRVEEEERGRERNRGQSRDSDSKFSRRRRAYSAAAAAVRFKTANKAVDSNGVDSKAQFPPNHPLAFGPQSRGTLLLSPISGQGPAVASGADKMSANQRKRLARNLQAQLDAVGPGSRMSEPPSEQMSPSRTGTGGGLTTEKPLPVSPSHNLSSVRVVSQDGPLPAIDFLAGVDDGRNNRAVNHGPGSRFVAPPAQQTQSQSPDINYQNGNPAPAMAGPISADAELVAVPRVAHPMYN